MKRTHTQPWQHTLVVLLLASCLLAGAGAAQAAPPASEPPVTTVSYPGMGAPGGGTILPSGFSIKTGGTVADNTLTFTTATGGGLTRLDAQSGYSAFAPGTKLIETFDGSNADGPLTISFSKPITSFGLNAQDYYLDKETFTFSAFRGVTNVGMYTLPQTDNTSSTGQSVFLSASDAQGITSIVISSASVIPASGSMIGTNDFNVGPITFTNAAPVPEASTYVSFGLLMGLGGLGLAAKRRSNRLNRTL